MKRLTFLLFCLLLGIGMANAQTTKVTGTVISAEDNEPIIGASIVVKGTTIGTVTDFNGAFSLDVPSSAKTLVVSFVGMKSQEIGIKPTLHVVLAADNQMLDEVMVVAYGTAKKSSFTGAASSVNAEKVLKDVPVTSFEQALQGATTGLTVNSSSGQPGAGLSIRNVRSLTRGDFLAFNCCSRSCKSTFLGSTISDNHHFIKHLIIPLQHHIYFRLNPNFLGFHTHKRNYQSLCRTQLMVILLIIKLLFDLSF